MVKVEELTQVAGIRCALRAWRQRTRRLVAPALT